MARKMVNIDGNEAAAYVAYKTNEVCAIYPITPSSNMGEWADLWSSMGQKNIWGTSTVVSELQSEGGASGSVHGALQTGALTTTFTASQGLLLMIPNMFKIAGELTSTVFHIAARSIATHALSIFGDHSDVMATRSTGWALLPSGSVQEVMDFALISQAATLKARIPFLHFFDGFRVSHEVLKVEQLTDDDMRAMLPDELIIAHRERALSPDRPVIRGTAQNPDVFFQGREAANKYYDQVPAIVEEAMEKFGDITGRRYHLFDYIGAPDADRVIVIMGSGAEAAHEAVDYLTHKGEKVGLLKVRLYRPFSAEHFLKALPKTVKSLAVLDRTKEAGANGEPMYQDVITVLTEAMSEGNLPFENFPKVIGGRYGLSSKEFTPAMVKAIYDELLKEKPKKRFTVGINDDVTNLSLEYDPHFTTEADDVFRGMFWGLGADGTVGANKNSIKIIGEETDNYAQGYFVYDSKKSGSVTTSHLRFGPRPIRSSYLINSANFVACHQSVFTEQYDMLRFAAKGATFLLNSQFPADEVFKELPLEMQKTIIEKEIKFYVIDAYTVAKNTGMGTRINTIMQTCFFYISGILPPNEAIEKIKNTIKKTYGLKGDEVVQKNYEAVDQTIANLHKVQVPASVNTERKMPPVVSHLAPEFIRNVTAGIISGRGDDLPVSAFPVDGTYPTGSAAWEKRNIALEAPVWVPDLCIQCGKCALVCPHGVIRMKVVDNALLADAPETFKSMKAKGKEYGENDQYILQIAVEDCTGCELCVDACPAKDKSVVGRKALNMSEQYPLRKPERKNLEFFLNLPEYDRTKINTSTVRGIQFLQPLFEFSGACAGCGETPYVKLVSQLFGDRAIVANATGCSSIYGGNLPTTPWAKNKEGRGPAWSNSLFEDNAEFGFGFRLTLDKHQAFAKELLWEMRSDLGEDFVNALINAKQDNELEISLQRERVAELNKKLEKSSHPMTKQLKSLSENLVKRSVWIMGGDGWAYDIGYGGLDHVIASGKNVNILVLDTEVYSNTGGQMSKATPRGAVAKFAAGGKPVAKKDLGFMAMTYGNVYVAQVAFGANDNQTVKAFIEAEAYDGPSIIIAYSHCIAHGIDMSKGLHQQKSAVDSGYWPLYRFNPDLAEQGKNPLQIDSKPPKIDFKEFAYAETRYKMLTKRKPEDAARLIELAQGDVHAKWAFLKKMSS
ncbi:MAG TPA: pyruvate:ferredoxin (flavodoxin) oxidoreductase [Candidatus Marinimicrobia bacterium]|nr:pyruvate:ferredoxin (flavodoxin) oxidoreductase [Candidatus Neomarinimicrobiota bacterium]